MTASSSWFYCGACGFKNHPRRNQDNAKCEQCGALNTEKEAADYTPGGA